MRDNFDEEIERLRERIFPLARLLRALEQTLEPPKLIRRGHDRGFRYNQPGLTHFCLLRGVRIVSALNASIELARKGFTQEIATVLRTMIEYTTQIDFVLASLDDKRKLSDDASNFISGFFADEFRATGKHSKKAKLAQKTVHDKIGARLDGIARADLEFHDIKSAAELFSNIYGTFSNYVHGRYPESMDLYGGIPGRFHLQGMRRTPKDSENIEILDTMITSASNCFLGMVQDLNLRTLVGSDSMLVKWYQDGVNRTR